MTRKLSRCGDLLLLGAGFIPAEKSPKIWDALVPSARFALVTHR